MIARQLSTAVKITRCINATAAGLTVITGSPSKVVTTEVYRPKHRYIQGVVNRQNANAAIDFGLLIQFNAQRLPQVQPTTYVSAWKYQDYTDYRRSSSQVGS